MLPPGFALRIDYDPAASPASLLITALRDETVVGQAHVDPREVGLRLRLELAEGVPADRADASQLRLTPQRAMHAIRMDAVTTPRPTVATSPGTDTALHSSASDAPATASTAAAEEAMAALHELARGGQLHARTEQTEDIGPQRPLNALVWLDHGRALVLPAPEAEPEEQPWARVQRAIRAVSEAAAELLRDPLRLREAEDGWASWRASWRAAQPASGASE